LIEDIWPTPGAKQIRHISGPITFESMTYDSGSVENNRLQIVQSQVKKLLSLLIESGLQVDCWHPQGHQPYSFASSEEIALMTHICYNRWTDLVTLLLNHGANPHIMTDETPDPELKMGLLSVMLSMLDEVQDEAEEDLSCYKSSYFIITCNILEALLGQVCFEDIQPRWSPQEISAVELITGRWPSYMSQASSLEHEESLDCSQEDVHVFVENLKTWDRNPFSLKFYARRQIRTCLFKQHQFITFDVVSKLPIPSALYDYVNLSIMQS